MRAMRKVHVIMRKEEVDEAKLAGKIAVVLDVLLATTTITTCLQHRAREVIPVRNAEEAREVLRERMERAEELADGGNHPLRSSYILAGEDGGRPIPGFEMPSPTIFREKVAGKSVILSTTNGTVAVSKTESARHTYISSLLNGRAVAEHIARDRDDESVIVICSGSSGHFSLEDYYGAGYFVYSLLQIEPSWELSDAARAALYLYLGHSTDAHAAAILQDARVGQMILSYGQEEDLEYTARLGVYPVVPYVDHARRRIVAL
ncbi:2-phosphosulfolactate phosphatase [Brevibacillus dissolubilis]|uniref:2-phosphosulfolactate phosphatase n=1 Tax=Brevibacillus dissolubilis TaxID=1844116 RepID=UPI00210029F3|nr:2-phosphosulfolactate phosphatase [Brevibacillus dissolubilis]